MELKPRNCPDRTTLEVTTQHRIRRLLSTFACLVLIAPQVNADDAPTSPATATPAVGKPLPPTFAPTQFPLDFVTDRTDLVGDADIDSYYGLLDYVRQVEPIALRKAADEFREQRWKTSKFADWPLEEFPLYYDLTQQPAAYRGRPIVLTGHVQLHHVDHPENDYQIDPVHVAYLYTEDSQHHPARIVFTENPDQIPVGEQATSGVTAVGYFLKLYRYEDRDGKCRFMPLIVTRSLRWTPPRPAQFSLISQLLMAATLLGIIAIVVWGLRRARHSDAVAREQERH
ncbi:MAG: hypothetical protein KDA75_10985, partial [Planctomycetaceae bacterium]|nr:hypothetical protein [Planctomycetaceae bacterium]